MNGLGWRPWSLNDLRPSPSPAKEALVYRRLLSDLWVGAAGRANSVSHGAGDIWNSRPSAFPQLSEADGKVPRLVVPSFSSSHL